MSHLGQIALVAAEAKRNYRTVSVADVPAELRQPTVYVWADPEDADRSGSTVELPAQVEHVVIRPEDRPDGAVQPRTLSTTPVTFGNLLGGEWPTSRPRRRSPWRR